MTEAISLSKQDIRKLTVAQLKDWLTQHGEQGFRAKQIVEWLWKKSATSFDEMSNLSLKTRELLTEHFEIRAISNAKSQKSNDGTVKSAFKLHDGHLIEGVLIPADDRMTACVSSQVGCSLTCKFCATGYMDRKRNLDAAEMYDQVVAIDRQAKENFSVPLTNIVYMGMGEPLLNYANVLESIEKITSPEGLGMSPKRITVSTAGIAKMIKKLGDDEVKFNLALSLHAANDLKRNQIMPINESNSLENLAEALQYFYRKTKNRITFEYIVFNNFNDTLQDAKELWEFTKKVPAKVNIIEYNPIVEADFKNTGVDKLEQFARFLDSKGVIVNVRRSRGKDIDAACGQLANREKMNNVGLYLMAALYFAAGVIHLLKPRIYLRMMPPWVPMPLAAVLVSGVLEMAFAIGLLFAATRSPSAWGIILLLIAIFPANVYMLTSGKFYRIPQILLILRLPLQLVLIWWAYQYV